MKIIKKGKTKYRNRADYKLECSNCGCIFVCNYGDFESQENQLDGKAYYVRCPYCNIEIGFKRSEYLNKGEEQ